MAITKGNVTNGTGENVSNITISHTISSGDDRLLLVSVRNDGSDPSTVQYGGVSLTKLASYDYGNRGSLWYLKNPAVGTANIVLDWGSSSYYYPAVMAINLYGVDQTTTFRTVTNAGTSGTSISNSVVSEVDDLVVDFMGTRSVGGGTSNATLTSGDTDEGYVTSPSSINTMNLGTKAGASSSVTMSWGSFKNSYCRQLAVAVIPKPPLTLPTVSTSAVSSIDKTTATGNGNITDTGGEDNTKRGIVWDTTSRSDPGNTAPASSAYANYAEDTGTYSTGAFTKGLTGLAEGTTYYVRAYSYNSLGYSYGAEVSFKTDDAVQITKSLKYSVLVETSITKSLKYTVITEPSAITKSLKYTVVIEASAITKSLQYSVLTTPSGITKSLKYTVIVEISAITKSLSYEIITTPSAIQKSLLYAILTVPSALTKSLEYQVLVDTAITKSLQYTVEREVSAITKSLKYTVEITPSALTKSLEYVVVQRTSITKSLQYIVVAPVSITKSLKYTVTIEMSAITKSLVYAVRNEITAITKSMQYSVRSEASAITKSLRYTVTASASAITKDLNYIVFGRLLLQKSLQYSIQITPSAITKGLQYGILVETGITKSLKYVVGIETSVTKSLKYTVANNGIVITKSLQYAVLVRHRRNGSGYTRY